MASSMAYCWQPCWSSRGSRYCIEKQGNLQGMIWLTVCEYQHLVHWTSYHVSLINAAVPSLHLYFCLTDMFLWSSSISPISYPQTQQSCRLYALLSAQNPSWSAYKLIIQSILTQARTNICSKFCVRDVLSVLTEQEIIHQPIYDNPSSLAGIYFLDYDNLCRRSRWYLQGYSTLNHNFKC
jgi:hypothetical protein